jgi:6-phosphogluconate dehydrogenase
MQVGMIGLGRMGSAMTQRLLRGGHGCIVFDADAARVMSAVDRGATAASSLEEFVTSLDAPRIVWMMLPAGAVDSTLQNLSPLLQIGDVIVDGGNSHYVDDMRRARLLGERGITYADVGVSGGVRGLERGYCLMIGGGLQGTRSRRGGGAPNLGAEFRNVHGGRGLPALRPDRGRTFREDGSQRD